MVSPRFASESFRSRLTFGFSWDSLVGLLLTLEL